MKNPKVKASVLKAGTDRMETEVEARESRVQKRIASAGTFSKVTDRIARDTFHVRNQRIPKGQELFPAEWKMQFVDLFYPYAKSDDGNPTPIYIDMPVTTHDLSLCVRKMEVLRAKGLRYTYLKVGEGEWEGRIRMEGGDPDKIKADQRAGEREASQ